MYSLMFVLFKIYYYYTNIYKICYHGCGVMNSLVAQINFQPMRILETRTCKTIELLGGAVLVYNGSDLSSIFKVNTVI